MKKKILVILIFILLSACRKSDTENSFLNSLFPQNSTLVTIMGASISPRSQELQNLFRLAIQKHNEWFLEYVMLNENLKQGEVLPYHSNFEMSKEEYYEMGALMDSITFIEIDSEMINIERESNRYRVLSGDKLPQLQNIVIDFETGSLSTPIGICKKYSKVKKLTGKIGTWSGYSWKYETGSLSSGNAATITFNLGLIEENKKKFIYYRAKKIDNGVLCENIDLLIYY